ncbi:MULTISPECIES: hypothetical protein [Comamonas]|uniref:hypothetical protein n=1 Tax=Comamonas TaxID=283 RepID=UPI00237E5D1E|nr:hypothetical protein [Comamonas aquatica]
MSQFASKDDLLAAQAARIAELESQLEAIGAGGVEPLRKPAAAPQAVQAAVPEAIEQMAVDRYKVVPSHESMFHRWAVVADNGAQQLYIGREGECQNMARKFMGAFLDGAFVAMQNATPAHPAEGVPATIRMLDDRAAFEASVQKEHYWEGIRENLFDRLPSGKYAVVGIERHWQTWMAALAGTQPAAPQAVQAAVRLTDDEILKIFTEHSPGTDIGRELERAVWSKCGISVDAPAHPVEGAPSALLQLADLLESGRHLIEVERREAANALRLSATQPAAQGLAALTPAARDVLAERKRQIESEGWKTERDDVYDTGEMALAAACYAAHSASCAAIKAPHTARGVFVRTRSAQDFVGEMWPWSADWWKPSGHRRNLEKAAALILAEIERIDRAALAAQAKQGGA